MSLDTFVKKKEHVFKQSELLKGIGKPDCGGICLSLAMHWAHACARGAHPASAVQDLKGKQLFTSIAGMHEDYSSGKANAAGDPNDFQDPATFLTISNWFQKKGEKKLVFMECGYYDGTRERVTRGEFSGLRPGIRRDLLSRSFNVVPKVYVLAFNLKEGRMGIEGAHAIGVYLRKPNREAASVLKDGIFDANFGLHGIFDPNFGWMEFTGGGFADMDLSVVLNEFVSEYGIYNATANQIWLPT